MSNTEKPADKAPDYSAIRARVSPKAVRMASLFDAKSDVRHYLYGLHIEPAPQGGIYVVASDGSTMLVFHDKAGNLEGAQNILIRTNGALTAACANAMRREELAVIVEGSRLSVAPDFGMAHASDDETHVMPGCCHINARTRLDWLRVIPNFPKLKQAPMGSVDSRFLERIHKAAQIGSSPNLTSVHFWAEGESHPIAVQFEHTPEALAIIMPVRSDNKLCDLAMTLASQKTKAKAA